jgi:hypothetical protein
VLCQAVDSGEASEIPDNDLQALLAGAIRVYSLKIDQGGKLSAFKPMHKVTATDVAVTATGMLAAVEMAVFELGMWQNIKGLG